MLYQSEKIRNILFLGHQGCGKTTLVEALASLAFKTPKGSIERKNTISDYTVEEKNRLSSCNMAIVPIEYNGYKLNLIDVPGNDSFIYEIIGVLDMIKGAILVIDGQKGLEVGTVKHYNFLRKHGVPTFIFINKLDKESVKYEALLEAIKTKLGKQAISFVYPIGKEDSFDGYIDVISLKAKRHNGTACVEEPIHDDKKEKVMALNNAINEQVAVTDEALLEKFFAGETLSKEEVQKGLHAAVLSGDLTPILVGSAVKDIGLDTMLEMMIDYLPNPNELKPYVLKDEQGQEVIRHTVSDEPFSAYVFKTGLDQYKGTTNIVKVCSGTLNLGDEIYCPNTKATFKVSQMFFLSGSKQIPAETVHAGDIVALAKLEGVI
ncbi:MAG: GTP-binding protein, partial [Bacilli bacterium]